MVTLSRKAALDILIKIDRENSYGNLELKKQLPKHQLSLRDRALVTEMVYGVLRYRYQLDFFLNSFLKKDLESLRPTVREILRLGAYQILFLDKVPDAAACNESVKLAKKTGYTGFKNMVNGVLRNMARHKGNLPWPDLGDAVEYISVKYAHPPWMVKRWLQRFTREEVETLCRANNCWPLMSIRVNTLRANPVGVRDELEKEGFQFTQGLLPELLRIRGGGGDISSTAAFDRGLFTIQGENSALAGHLLAPVPGEQVADLCSAPGGKATHMAQLMEGQGKIIAGDLYPHRVNLVHASSRRLGLKNIETRVFDATRLPSELQGKMDRVLLDAPCSGLGVIRRKPDLKWHKRASDFQSLAALQKDLLREAGKLVKGGGQILYCVCTNEPEETVGVVDSFLETVPEFAALSLMGRLPPGVSARETGSGIHLYPHQNEGDGFYYALLTRRG